MEVELPECPVCLQVYNREDTIPRVLACGHSVCEGCLGQLHQRFPNTIRCPACNQLVNFPRQQGPSALPKNIDLLSFINQQNPNPNSSRSHHKQSHNGACQPEFLPRLWSEDFYSSWKDWVVPKDAVFIEQSGGDPFISIRQGRITSSASSSSMVNRRCCFRENQIVSLLHLFSSPSSNSVFNASYIVRIMEALHQLNEGERAELDFILRAFSIQFRLCKVYGLWMNSVDGSVFLVCERFNDDFPENLCKLRNVSIRDCLSEDEKQDSMIIGRMSDFALVGMELCEAVIVLHSEGLVSGCLSLSCFSCNNFGRAFVDVNEVLVTGRRVRKCIAEVTSSSSQRSNKSESEGNFNNLFKTQAFVSPELLLKLLHNKGIKPDSCSDVWSLACILVSLLVGYTFTKELFKGLYLLLLERSEELCSENQGMYRDWVERVSSALENLLGTEFGSLLQILYKCFDFDPGCRPHVTDVWKCVRELIVKPHADIVASPDARFVRENTVHCLTLGVLCDLPKGSEKYAQRPNGHDLQGSDDSCGTDFNEVKEETDERDLIEGLCQGKFKSINLQGHLDCITGLAVGGGFLFSSSFDKTVHVWSLQDFSHVQSFRGHEHRVMAVVFVNTNDPVCISGDIGGGLFVWGISISSGKEPLTHWYEHKDWRYSGVHALAVSGIEYLYTGSGDKSIKAWSLQDYTLTCTMSGHKSVVSSLAVCDGVLYSGSWDGTIRLWCLNDHSPLTILGDDTPGTLASVSSLSVDHHMLVAAHENGCVKIWRNDFLSRSIQTDNGAILALDMEGKWLFTGGWNKTVNVQELSGDELQVDTRPIGSIACDSVITALLYWEGKLFVGFADRAIKVYYYGS